MTDRRIVLAGTCALILLAQPSLAGPCIQDIDRMQAQVDARIDAVAGSGPAGAESNAARLHREPTPGSIARAEEKLDEGRPEETALAALTRARAADAAGDRAACDAALAKARQALQP